jgi:tetratricopeptide (TPR) repeat protein
MYHNYLMSSSVGDAASVATGRDELCISSVGPVDVISDDELEGIGPLSMNLGSYSCEFVTNIPADSDNNDPSNPRTYFDLGLRHFYAYQHEEAYKCFLATLTLAPDCAFAHGMVALCHSPNYNFKGDAYYESTDQPEEEQITLAGGEDITCLRRLYPSQQVAHKHSILAMEKIEELKVRFRKRRWSSSSSITDEGSTQHVQPISDIEVHLLSAIRTLTLHPGIQPDLAERTAGRPYADALAKVYERFGADAEVCYFYAESLMVLHAWKLYEYPTGRPLSEDVRTIESVLESALKLHPDHAGLCHLYVHLCEMSSNPEKALNACDALRKK